MARERKFSKDDLFQATEQLLLMHGYEGFTFSLLADDLDVSRGALYKYYENKEELITDYMLYEMEHFLTKLKEIELRDGFEEQFDFLLNLIFSYSDIQKMIKIGQQIPVMVNKKVKENKDQLDKHLLEMYLCLQNFLKLGKEEKKLNPSIPEAVILGYIFQSVAIPNHFNIPHSVWVRSIKEMICHGMFIKT
ncbi:TetR/AcrR family transcriptional regulator [Paenibacillus sp. BSR1-1]|uniref:TetR/AcrR family transcriptional regulator n=1 Tax=Paenibacillus sp. BSR1-1 TaxID=3020845 RepID=UPI0025B13D0B|nr:TetR/AcrR family transcriptional regulator [Paenibacillus sp. BSR1-1]MDN3019863.1 TetR/AcrR family transcriptional regulator [Paenibacillus sp. BSR1-1]